jgi:hypothetical protein
MRYNPSAEWTVKDVVGRGGSIDEAAEFLCRAGSVDDVERKARDLGLIRRDAQ